MNIVALAADDRGGPDEEPDDDGPEPSAPAPKPDPLQFDEAIASFRKRVPMTDAEFDALEKIAHDRALRIAGVAQLDVVNDVWAELDKAISKGTTFAEFKKAVGKALTKSWGGEKPGRIENIFRTNVQSAYGAGRVKQLQTPAVLRARPFWKFSAVEDARTSPYCRPIDGTILPADAPWWGSHQPPLHYQCRSTIIPLRAEQAQEMGITAEPPEHAPMTGFGNVEASENWKPDLSQYPTRLRAAFEEKNR